MSTGLKEKFSGFMDVNEGFKWDYGCETKPEWDKFSICSINPKTNEVLKRCERKIESNCLSRAVTCKLLGSCSLLIVL